MRFPPRRQATLRAARLALVYALGALLWILLSDQLLLWLGMNTPTLAELQTAKGAGFVLATGMLLFFLLRHELRGVLAAEQRRRISEEQVTTLLSNVRGYSVVLLDPDGGVLSWNVGAERNSGYPAAQVLGRHIRQFYPAEARAAGRPDRLLEAAARSGVHEDEGWALHASGEPRWLHSTYTAVRDGRGELIGYTAVIRDLTEQHRALEALEGERQTMAAAIAAIPGMFLVTDGGGRLVRWNQALERLSGRDERQLSRLRALALFPHEERPRLVAFHDELTTLGNARLETLLEVPGAEPLPILLTGSSFTHRGERWMVATGIDLSAYREVLAHQRRLAAVLEATPDIVGIVDDRGRYRYLNNAGRRLLGLPAGLDPASVDPDRYVVEQDRPALREGVEIALAGGCWRGELRLRGSEGETIPVSLVIVAQHPQEGDRPWWSSICRDIRPQKQVEAALRESEQRYRQLYDFMPSMIFSVDQSGRILAVNRFCADTLETSPAELEGQPFARLHRWEHRAAVRHKLRECLQAPEQIVRWEACLLRNDGSETWVRANARPLRTHAGQPTVLVACEDITEVRVLSEELSFRASHDVLTGLINRRELERRLQRLLERARSQGEAHALCYLDLDQFKLINDTLSHAAGDELLRQLALELQGAVERGDSVARLGGDDFAVLLENCDMSCALRTAEQLRERIEGFRFHWGGRHFELAASIGVLPIIDTSEDVPGLLRLAEATCYAAKERGRNRIHVYDEQDETLLRRHGEMQWANRIPLALEEDRFRLYFQPICPVQRQEQGLHYEVLLRLQDEHGRLVEPGQFLPASERYSLTPRLDRWVVRNTLRWLRAHPEHLERLSLCSINLSGLSVGNHEFLEFVLWQLDRSGVPAEKICFEITETAAVSNVFYARRFINALEERGCRFALDDFGAGLSSFGYLKNLPVDYLKIDGSFVRDILNDPIDLSLVRSINEVGHAMNKCTIAEFVESRAIFDKLAEIGVDYAQGYQTGRPRPLEELLQLH